jgi:mono/diheme cytochrome c family protein
MPRHRQSVTLLSISLLTWLLVPVPGSRGADVDVEDLRPGLVANHRAGDPAIEIVRLEPAVALNCKAGEAVHPRLAADGGSSAWTGYINILRAGNYRFSASLRGKLEVSVAGKAVFNAEAKSDKPTQVSGPEVRLEAGAHPFVAKFTRYPGAARLELRWQGPQFPAEPLPYDALFHLPAKVPAQLATDQQVERGRFLVEERSCTGCHKPDAGDKLAKTLTSRQGPDLSQVGSRVHPGWLVAWLQNPQAVRPGAAMPQMFTPDEAGRVDAHAVARYLSTVGGPLKDTAKPPNPNDLKTAVKLGKMLFTTAGCIACHDDDKAKNPKKAEQTGIYGAASNFPLGALGSKTTHEKLAVYLSNPHAVDPSGRMPNMLLEGKEASDLARFLCEVKDKDVPADLTEQPSREQLTAAFKRLMPTGEDQTAFDKLKPEQQWLELGKRLVVEKNCTACHTIAPDKKPLAGKPAKASFAELKTKHTAGCLVDDIAKRGAAPGFTLSEADRKALRLFLKDGTTGAGSPAPAHAARVTIQRLNCLACHSRDGEGGLSTDLLDELRRYEKAENAEAVSPPPLTGVGHKLRTPWLKQVLTQKGRARPWMGLRMPQFGDANVAALPEALAALEGTEPDDDIHKEALSAAKIDAGRKLVGKGGFGCISCHDIAGIPNTGTRGPDLAGMNQRVRFEWYGRWLSEAQRMQPGTRMPTVFPEGKSPLDSVLNGDAKAQAEAVWAYLSLGSGLPLPEGLEPPKGLILSAKDRPYVLRTFMPAPGDNYNGARYIAVGYPCEVSTAFDANTCRLAYAWSGNFLNAAPVWADRGGNKAKILGPTFWTSPAGCPWGVNDSNEPPDFTALAKNPAYGATMPNNKVFDGQKQLQFDGYSLDKDGLPTFRYRVEASESNPVSVKERPEPLRRSVAVGMGRHFALHVPAQRVVWLLAGETSAEPRVLDGKAKPVTVDLKAGKLELPAADRLVVLPQEADKIIVLGVSAAPEGSKWLLQKQAKTWQLLLRLPPPDKASDLKVDLNVWAPFRDEAELLRELITKK